MRRMTMFTDHRRLWNASAPIPRAELEEIVGAEVYRRLRVINHNAYDGGDVWRWRGQGRTGARPLMMNRAYVEADRRILVGFIEPHFMAGFSGGYKAAFPGVADLDFDHALSPRRGHLPSVQSKWGTCSQGNPTQSQIRANGSVLPVDFLVNVTLNHKRQITRFFCGDVIAAHEEGCRYVEGDGDGCRSNSSFPFVITTNSGFPLDQNLYQSVKGMSAAAEIIADNGEMLVAARCNDGFPEHGNFHEAALRAQTRPRPCSTRSSGPIFSCSISGRRRSSPRSRCGRGWRSIVSWSRTPCRARRSDAGRRFGSIPAAPRWSNLGRGRADRGPARRTR